MSQGESRTTKDQQILEAGRQNSNWTAVARDLEVPISRVEKILESDWWPRSATCCSCGELFVWEERADTTRNYVRCHRCAARLWDARKAW